jgi:hypothetical protein
MKFKRLGHDQKYYLGSGAMAGLSACPACTIWDRFFETVSAKIYKPNLVKSKFVIMTFYGFQIP